MHVLPPCRRRHKVFLPGRFAGLSAVTLGRCAKLFRQAMSPGHFARSCRRQDTPPGHYARTSLWIRHGTLMDAPGPSPCATRNRACVTSTGRWHGGGTCDHACTS
ncbi:hypothetical protein BCR44DRAFT_1042551 [Catenaria anguillulae PL171]|uniref:Uncharacterized protein n=1 Tax=Catenaria anguillulae PL171 TaxID=765915 RepID=A0A1Y2HRQ0_9FUNG|nr:hypothetical protein BCR44DRAFT_1042551 [Catenaria anguillulae PL171]